MIRTRNRPPTHPGGILKRQYVDPLHLSVTSLADSLNISRKTLSKIVNEHAGITPDMALRLSKAFDTTPEFWINLQSNYDLWHAANESQDWKLVHSVALAV